MCVCGLNMCYEHEKRLIAPFHIDDHSVKVCVCVCMCQNKDMHDKNL